MIVAAAVGRPAWRRLAVASAEEQSVAPRLSTERSSVLDELTSAWERGERPPLEILSRTPRPG